MYTSLLRVQSPEIYSNIPLAMKNEIKLAVTKRFGEESPVRYPSDFYAWFAWDLAFEIGNQVATYHLDHTDQSEKFLNRLDNSLDILKNIQNVLHPMDSKKPSMSRHKDIPLENLIWWHKHVYWGIQDGETTGHYLPYINVDYLSSLGLEYLANPWMECPALESALVSAMTYSAALEKGLYLKENRWVGRFFNLFTPFQFLFTALGLNMYEYFEHKKITSEMIAVSELLTNPQISPEFVKQRLLITTEKGAKWPYGAFTLADFASRRSPSAWWVKRT
jgi:hypothetical protein